MEPKTKQYLLITAFGVGLFAALTNLQAVLGFAGKVVGIIFPVIAGGILALFINVPLSGIEKRLKKLFGKAKKKPSDNRLRAVSFAITLMGILLVFLLVLTLLIPEIIRSLQRLALQLEESVPRWLAYLDGHDLDAVWLEEMLAGIDLKEAMKNIPGSVNSVFSNVANAFSSAVNVMVTAAFAVIISVYMVLGKEWICRHTRMLVQAYVKPEWADSLFHISRVFNRTFAKFLSGQCSEAVILGILMFLAFTLCGLPYGSLAGVLTAVCALIPYVGALISGAVSVILTLLIDPALALRCLIVYLAVQFVENQFIYPRVVGGSVGLPPLYTLAAAMIGGNLFGIMGIIFFIPLTAVAAELVKEDARKRLRRRGGH